MIFATALVALGLAVGGGTAGQQKRELEAKLYGPSGDVVKTFEDDAVIDQVPASADEKLEVTSSTHSLATGLVNEGTIDVKNTAVLKASSSAGADNSSAAPLHVKFVAGADYDGFVRASVSPRYLRSAAAPVGVLYVVMSFASPQHPGKRVDHYLAEVQSSVLSVRTACPDLPTALATDLAASREVRSTFDFIVAANTTVYAQRWRQSYLARVAALAASPFELTLELDATVQICSSMLHGALAAAHRNAAIDFAVNFESSPLAEESQLPAPIRRYNDYYGVIRPGRVTDFLPHNFALLVRKGRPLTALLKLWSDELKLGKTADDQRPLRESLRALHAADFRVCLRESRMGPSSCVRVGVHRLTDAAAAFKSAAKGSEWASAGQARGVQRLLYEPRFTRPFAGPMLLLHTVDGSRVRRSPALPRRQNGSSASSNRVLQGCQMANSFSTALRLITSVPEPVQKPGRKQEHHYDVLYSREDCHARYETTREYSPAPAFYLPVCSMLPSRGGPEPQHELADHPPALTETLESFWSFAVAADLTR